MVIVCTQAPNDRACDGYRLALSREVARFGWL